MKENKRLRTIIIALVAIAAILIIGVAILAILPSSATAIDLSAKLSELVGVVEVRNPEQENFNPVNEGFILKVVQQLQTKEESRVRLDLSTGSIVRLGQRTVFSLDTPTAESGGILSRIQLQAGRVWVVLNGGSLDVNTPGGLASVRGSYMSVWVEQPSKRITVCCLEGHCRFNNSAGAVDLTAGQKIVSSDINVLPAIQGMDQVDFQTWIDNSPESHPVVTQIYPLMATSTASLTPESSLMSLNTSTPTSIPTFTNTPCLDAYTPTPTNTPTPTYEATATPGNSPTPTDTSTPTRTPTPTLPGAPCPGTATPDGNSHLTPTQTYTPTATKTATIAPRKTPTPTNPPRQQPTATDYLPTQPPPTEIPPTEPPTEPTATQQPYP